MTAIQEIQTDDLTTETRTERTSFIVQLVGTAEMSAMSDLDGFLSRLHKAALVAHVPEVVIDIRTLEFMNSSCFKAFVRWITAIEDAVESTRYHVRIRGDANKHWQRRSLAALACFAADLIEIEI